MLHDGRKQLHLSAHTRVEHAGVLAIWCNLTRNDTRCVHNSRAVSKHPLHIVRGGPRYEIVRFLCQRFGRVFTRARDTTRHVGEGTRTLPALANVFHCCASRTEKTVSKAKVFCC